MGSVEEPKRDFVHETHRQFRLRLRAWRAVQLRAEGKTWREVAEKLKYRTPGAALNAVKHWEGKRGKS